MVGGYLFVNNNTVNAETKVLDNGLFRIKNAYSGLYLDIKDGSNANGAIAIQAQGADNSSQIFRISKQSTLMYIISIEKNKKVLEIEDGNKTAGALIQQWDFTNKTHQEWNIRQLADNTVVIINYSTNTAISIDDGDLRSGSIVKSMPYTGTKNQKWILEPENREEEVAPVKKEETTNNSSNGAGIITRYFTNASTVEIAVIGVVVFIVLFYIIGYLLYGFRIKPRFIIKGRLYYKPASREDEKFVNYMDFKRKNRKKIIISFNQSYKKADFYIGDGSNDYQIIIEKITEMNLPHFLEGYRSFNIENNPMKIRVTATEPGILNFGEFVYSKHYIVDGSKFESGDILFRYVEDEKK